MLLCLEVGICFNCTSGGCAHASVEQGAVRYYTLKAVLYFTRIQAHKQGSLGNCLIAGHVILSPPLNSWGGRSKACQTVLHGWGTTTACAWPSCHCFSTLHGTSCQGAPSHESSYLKHWIQQENTVPQTPSLFILKTVKDFIETERIITNI